MCDKRVGLVWQVPGVELVKSEEADFQRERVYPHSSACLLLSSLEFSDKQVYEPLI